jgi:Flp pilus assembly protein TadG
MTAESSPLATPSSDGIRRLAGDERGVIVVITSVLMVVLFGFAALVVDLANARQQRLQTQTAADAAALAAAGELKAGGTATAARAAAEDIATSNGVGAGRVSVHVPPSSGGQVGDRRCVEVLTSGEVATTFGRIFGKTSLAVSGRAVSCAHPPATGGAAVFGGSASCQNTVEWAGSSISVTGGVHTNRDLKVSGATNVVNGTASYVSSVDAPPDKITFNPSAGNPAQLAATLAYPVSFAIADYAPSGARASLALGQGLYHDAGNTKIDMGWLQSRNLWNDTTKQLAPGLYYTTSDIDLSASSITGHGVTLVSANGQISLSGSSHNLTPWDPNGLLAFSNHQKMSEAGHAANCTSVGVKLSGSTHSWAGIIYAPRSQIEMSGSSNTTLRGALIGLTTKLAGSTVSLAYDHRFGEGSIGLFLVE